MTFTVAASTALAVVLVTTDTAPPSNVADVGRELPVTVQSATTALERWNSADVAGWAQTADAVVVLEVTAEQESARKDLGDYSGTDVIGRTVDLSVGAVVWQATGSPRPPESFSAATFGWIVPQGTDDRSPMAFSGTPRLEVGERYLAAVVYDECSMPPNNGSHWTLLGSQGVWPLSNGVIGYGESEGRRVEGDPGQAASGSFEAMMIGKTPADVGDVLAATRSVDRENDCRMAGAR